MSDDRDISLPQHSSHSRHWRENLYVYPVISRRSKGLSIGINVNPDTACNFDCVYCQVDRTVEPRVRDVDLDVVRSELERMIALATSGRLWQEPQFAGVPEERRRLNDIALSGDGEPTTFREFKECVQLVADCKEAAELRDVKIVLITDACYLMKRNVAAALEIMDDNQGEIWAKLDAGTEEYYRLVNRPNYPLEHVVRNITAAATMRPVVIQSLFLRLEGTPPSYSEIGAFIDRMHEIRERGGAIDRVQVYTVARTPAEDYATALSREEIDDLSKRVEQAGFRVETYYG